MPHHKPAPTDLWQVEGRFQQLIYSPMGGIEGVLIDADDIATQFVADPQDLALMQQLAALAAGQTLVLEGTEEAASPKGEAAHTVYRLVRLVSVDGSESTGNAAPGTASGTVVQFNYAKHGEANGVVLDSGDFVHTKPDGLKRLDLKVGDKLRAEGPARPLATGTGRVLEAQRVNGQAIGPH